MDGHDTSFPEKEYVLIREYTDQTPFVLAAFQVDSRNADLSLWKTTAVRKDCFPYTDGIRYIIGATPKKGERTFRLRRGVIVQLASRI